MIDVAYICNKQKECNKSQDCGTLCIHTCDPTYAKHQETVSLAADLISKFYYSGDIKLTEKTSSRLKQAIRSEIDNGNN